jgi:hypothetical protein
MAKLYVKENTEKYETAKKEQLNLPEYRQVNEIVDMLNELDRLRVEHWGSIYQRHVGQRHGGSGRSADCNICKPFYDQFNDGKYATLRRRLYTLREHFNTILSNTEVCKTFTRYKYTIRSQAFKKMERLVSQYGKQTPRDLADPGLEIEPKRAFIKACPVSECRGFLSTQWKCGICNINVCKECHDPILSEVHVCDSDKVASVKLIAKQTRPCPSCSAVISKIDGCDQMFCTECKTAFSWNTGRIVTGHIHNPHYFEWMRKTGAVIPPAPVGNLLCNADMTVIINELTRRSRSDLYRLPQTEDQMLCYTIYIRYTNMQHSMYIIQTLRNSIQENDEFKRILRVRYLTREITEDEWKKALQRKEKSMHLLQNRIHLLEMFCASFSDILNTFMVSTPQHIILQLNNLMTFTIEQHALINKNCDSVAQLQFFIRRWTDNNWKTHLGLVI